MSRLYCIDDYEALARKRLPKGTYDYFRGGAGEERTLGENRQAYRRYALYYRTLVDVAERDLRVSLLGQTLPHPILVAPTAYHKLAHPDGEAATARGAAAAQALMVVSTLATTRLEEVAAATAGPKWFQLYVHKDRGLTRSLIERAVQAGYQALVVTVDTPLLGKRIADLRNDFVLPPGLRRENLVDGAPVAAADTLAQHFANRHDASLSWQTLEWVRAQTTLPILLKGIVRGDDAERAATSGMAGVIVSNHGGRQLDGAPATIDALPEVVRAVAGRCPVLVDGGIRCGSDVLIALGLGADAVLVGRPILWGLAAGGEAGVRSVLELLRDELSLSMAMAGCPSLAAARQAGLVRPL